MKQLILFVESVYGKRISGRLYIYNLFNIQNPKSVNAIDHFESLVASGEYDLEEFLVSVEELRSHPWLLLGWGVKRESRWRNLELVKDKWRALISEAQITAFGKKHTKRNDYYHPRPQLIKQQQVILQELTEIYKKTI